MDVLCTDKTGTLTMDHVILEIYCDVFKNENEEVLRDAYLISHFQTGLKNVLDRAVLAAPGTARRTVPRQIHQGGRDPLRFLAPDDVGGGRRARTASAQLLTKGAPEAVFARCTHFESDGEIFPMEPILVGDLIEQVNDLSADGFRVLAVATKKVREARRLLQGRRMRAGPDRLPRLPRPAQGHRRQAIAALRQHGVTVKVLTGDNDLVTRKVCSEVGINAEKILLGSQVETMTDAQLAEAVETTDVFARLSPAHKQRIVQALQRKGHVVGFMGDGINDAPALRAADVGISVDTAVDIAKESADVILLEKSLMVLEEGVLEGRKVFVNILKYIRMGASSNFGNMFSVIGASAWLPYVPMAPHPDPHQQSALRFLPGADPDRQRRPAADCQAAALAHGRDRQVHPLHRPDQLDLRLHHLLRHVVRVQVQRPGPDAPAGTGRTLHGADAVRQHLRRARCFTPAGSSNR